MGTYWKSFLGAVKNRQKHVNTRRRFIYLLQYLWKNPERQKLRGSAMLGAATERGVSVCTACSATGWGSPLLILDIRWCRWCFCSARPRTLLLWTLPANTTAHKVNDWSARLRQTREWPEVLRQTPGQNKEAILKLELWLANRKGTIGWVLCCKSFWPESAALRCELLSVCVVSQHQFESETFPLPAPWR